MRAGVGSCYGLDLAFFQHGPPLPTLEVRTMDSSRPKALLIGCGIAGPVAAIALKRAGFEVEVYEARNADIEDGGAFLGLAPNGVHIVQQLGLQQRLTEYSF